MKQRTAPQCTCGNKGTCGYCPIVAQIATAQSKTGYNSGRAFGRTTERGSG